MDIADLKMSFNVVNYREDDHRTMQLKLSIIFFGDLILYLEKTKLMVNCREMSQRSELLQDVKRIYKRCFTCIHFLSLVEYWFELVSFSLKMFSNLSDI